MASERREPFRRKPQERSRRTRQRLIDATIETWLREGAFRTTTQAICLRAGLTRGAQVHHFPTKADLEEAAAEELFRRRVDTFRKRLAELPRGGDRVDAVVDVAWSVYSDRYARAFVELLIAARSDATLRRVLRRSQDRVNPVLLELAFELFGESARTRTDFPVTLLTVLDAMLGMAVTDLGGPGGPPPRRQLALLKQLLRQSLGRSA